MLNNENSENKKMPITKETQLELTRHLQKKLHTVIDNDNLELNDYWTFECAGCGIAMMYRVDNLLGQMRNNVDHSCIMCRFNNKSWDFAQRSNMKLITSMPDIQLVLLECNVCGMDIYHNGTVDYETKCICQKPGREDEADLVHRLKSIFKKCVYNTRGFTYITKDDETPTAALHVDAQNMFNKNGIYHKNLIEKFEEEITHYQIRVPLYSLNKSDPLDMIVQWMEDLHLREENILLLHNKPKNRYQFLDFTDNAISFQRFK